MKKLILLLTLLPILSYGQTTTPYVEVNTGISTGIVPFFPGASVLYGATTKYNSGIILDYEAGIAFPSLITFKGGVGYDFNGTQVSVGIRPWPATTYGQVEISRPKKLSDIVITLESMLWSENFFVQRGLVTVGWRFKNMKYRDIRKKNK
jgi:hypothetical protein